MRQLKTIGHSSLFANDVFRGLSSEQKWLPSKYFYDEKGSELFTLITRHPDYYLTLCGLEILDKNKRFLSTLFEKTRFQLVELGPGEGLKSRLLIQQFIKDSRDFSYVPIDISRQYINQLATEFQHDFSSLIIKPMNCDYGQGLRWLKTKTNRQNFVLFLGSSIGNLSPHEAAAFLKQMQKDLRAKDYFLIGFDLQKKEDVLLKAYNDKAGITRAFNLNLLARMNRELQTNFDLKVFEHLALYNPSLGAMESYLVSLKKQEIYSPYHNHYFYFKAMEGIHVEYSYKYQLAQIEGLAKQAGFKVIRHFTDNKGYFVNSLWQNP